MNTLATLSFGPDGGGDYLVLLAVLVLGGAYVALRRFERLERDENAAELSADPDPWHYVGTPGEPPFENGWGNATARPYDYDRDGPIFVLPDGYVAEGGIPCAS